MPKAKELTGERKLSTPEPLESRLGGMERGEMLSEQPVELIIEEDRAQKIVKKGAGALMLDKPEPTELNQKK